MAIVYCDFASGNDDTGDGSAGNPYKTITKASTGLTGGDEVRCAKSPDHSAMPGTMAFVDGSQSVATSADLTGSLAAKDFVSLNTSGETWWEISSITSTTITLVKSYSGTGGTGTGYKMGYTVVVASSGSEKTQSVSASGSSSASRLKISGGWNLAGTPAKDGHTFFWQDNSGSRYGYGLSFDRSYIHIDGAELGFFRFRYGMVDEVTSSGNLIDGVTSNGNLYFGISTVGSNHIIQNCVACGTVQSGYPAILLSSAKGCAITNCRTLSNPYGIKFTGGASHCTVSDCYINRNTTGIFSDYYSCDNIVSGCEIKNNTDGIWLQVGSVGWIVASSTFGSNTHAIYLTLCGSVVLYNMAHDESTWSNAVDIVDWQGNTQKAVSIQESESGGAARNRVYFYGGYTQDNAAEADGGTGKCLQFNPKSATYWIEQDFQVPVTAATARTIAIKMKDDASFNGSVYLELWYLGALIVGPTAKTMTESYVSQEITASAGQITVDGVLTLKVKVYGTAGAVYADTLTYS